MQLDADQLKRESLYDAVDLKNTRLTPEKNTFLIVAPEIYYSTLRSEKATRTIIPRDKVSLYT